MVGDVCSLDRRQFPRVPRDAAAQDRASIQSLNDTFSAAFDAGDFASMASHSTEDAILLPPGAEMMKGHSAMQALLRPVGPLADPHPVGGKTINGGSASIVQLRWTIELQRSRSACNRHSEEKWDGCQDHALGV